MMIFIVICSYFALLLSGTASRYWVLNLLLAPASLVLPPFHCRRRRNVFDALPLYLNAFIGHTPSHFIDDVTWKRTQCFTNAANTCRLKMYIYYRQILIYIYFHFFSSYLSIGFSFLTIHILYWAFTLPPIGLLQQLYRVTPSRHVKHR